MRESVRILIAEDSEAGWTQWGCIESALGEFAGTSELICTSALNVADLLLSLKRLEMQDRRPDLIVVDLNMPVGGNYAAERPGLPTTTKAGVWLALKIRRAGNTSSRLALWTNNVIANEFNDAYAFCRLEVNGRRIGDAVIDKSEDLAKQASRFHQALMLMPDDGPIFDPPEPETDLSETLTRTLPLLEAGFRPAEIAQAEHLNKHSVVSRINRMRDELCPEVNTAKEFDLRTSIVRAAREARIPWIPYNYLDESNCPF